MTCRFAISYSELLNYLETNSIKREEVSDMVSVWRERCEVLTVFAILIRQYSPVVRILPG